MSDDETPVCNASESILYSWAMGAPSFEMPDGMLFRFILNDSHCKTYISDIYTSSIYFHCF